MWEVASALVMVVGCLIAITFSAISFAVLLVVLAACVPAIIIRMVQRYRANKRELALLRKCDLVAPPEGCRQFAEEELRHIDIR
jgi:Na+(H+)/acetate symporter ActP